MFGFEVLLSNPLIVESPEELSYVRLAPHGMVLELLHHKDQPGAARPRGAKDPDYVLGPDATGLGATSILRDPLAQILAHLIMFLYSGPLPLQPVLDAPAVLGLIPIGGGTRKRLQAWHYSIDLLCEGGQSRTSVISRVHRGWSRIRIAERPYLNSRRAKTGEQDSGRHEGPDR